MPTSAPPGDSIHSRNDSMEAQVDLRRRVSAPHRSPVAPISLGRRRSISRSSRVAHWNRGNHCLCSIWVPERCSPYRIAGIRQGGTRVDDALASSRGLAGRSRIPAPPRRVRRPGGCLVGRRQAQYTGRLAKEVREHGRLVSPARSERGDSYRFACRPDETIGRLDTVSETERHIGHRAGISPGQRRGEGWSLAGVGWTAAPDPCRVRSPLTPAP
jgi:hypothetical protein